MNKTQIYLVAAALIIATLACAPLGGAAPDQAPVAVVASPTPPPIPTIPQITSAPPSQATTPPNEPSAPGEPTAIVYGSSRSGSMRLHYLTRNGRLTADLVLSDGTITHYVWPDVARDDSRIVFVSVQGSSGLSLGIFTANLDGSGVTPVIQGDGAYPKFSPDSSQIAYACNANTDICLINADGTGNVNLTADSPEVDTYPSWTPDGRIVFQSARGLSNRGRFADLFIMNADGSGLTAITNDLDSYNANPNVSPDGTRIVFESDIDIGAGSEIYVMNIDGTNRIRITNDSSWNQNPVWSPDGSTILFAADFGDGNIDLYQINPDGSNRVRLTQYYGEDGGFRWGHAWLPIEYTPASLTDENVPARTRPPSGSQAVTNQILFATNSFNCPDCLETGLYTVGFDGSNVTKLPISGQFPTWSPNFRQIAFVQNGELFIANADGSEVTQMTTAYMGLYSLSWRETPGDILAGCTPYGQNDVCLIEPSTGAINNLLDEIQFGTGIPYPTYYNNESILVGTLQIDLIGQVVSSLPIGNQARVSPTAERVAVIVNRQLTTMNFDGTGIERLTSDAPTKGFPIWSPDGSIIVYSIAPGDGRIYLQVINADGTDARPLVTVPIAPGPTTRPDQIEDYYGYTWSP